MSSRWWAQNLFKGRIGEALIEAVLSEFGYRVERVGYEQAYQRNPRMRPDLLVTHPKTEKQRFVEVKYRSARPTDVQIDAGRLAEYRKQFPNTILAIASAWDGAIYCSEVEDIPLSHANEVQTLSLLEDYWKPIWELFSLVERGDRLKGLWEDLQASLSVYGTRRIFGRQDRKLWDEEYEDLTRYLGDVWTEDLSRHGIPKPDTTKMTLEQLWQLARQINAASLAEELLQPSDEAPVHSMLMQQAASRALDVKGEQNITIDLDALSKALGENEDNSAAALISLVLWEAMKDPFNEQAMRSAEIVLNNLPQDVRLAYVLDQAIPWEDTEPINLEQMFKLIANRCRIDG